MADSRTRKQVDRTTRSIFYENLRHGLAANVTEADDAAKVRWLVAHGVTRGHAQRLVGFLSEDDMAVVQGPSIDLVGLLARAFGVTTAQFLTQGWRFTTIGETQDLAYPKVADAPREGLQRYSGRVPTRGRGR